MRAAVYLLTVAAALLISAQNTGADDPCVAATLNMVSVCGTFVTKVQNDAKLLGAATDAQIKDAASQGVQPSTQCCSVYNDFLTNACNCNRAVLSLANSQQTDAASVATQTRVWKASCGFANSLDKCPTVATTSTLG